jgi:membrane-associated protease RseP (regulator of RpoE activity)
LTGKEVEFEEAEQRRIEFNFPMLTFRTKMFGGVFDRLGSLRASRLVSWVALVIVPIVAGIGLYLISASLFNMLWTPAVREATRSLGPASYLLLPGINPFLPIVYGWIAIVVAIAIHEGAHGVIARNRGLRVKSSGLLFFLIVPIGAFVDVDEKQLAKAKPKDSLRVLAGGVGGNIVVAVACLLGVLLIIGGLTPIIDGVYVSEVTEGMPAIDAGLMAQDVFVSIDNMQIENLEELSGLLEDRNPGDVVNVVVARGENWEDRFSTSVNLTESEDGRTIMGVIVGDLLTEDRLSFYRTLSLETFSLYLVPPGLAPGLVPFSNSLAPFYSHDFAQWHVFASFLFWVWFVNVNVAIFNALPIYPLDGGRIFDISLKKLLGRKTDEESVSRTTIAMTVTLVVMLLMIVVIPFIL